MKMGRVPYFVNQSNDMLNAKRTHTLAEAAEAEPEATEAEGASAEIGDFDGF